MLDELRQMAIFAKTVEHGSFRGAARALDISPSGVSHHIAQLEERLGTALLYRSTRKLSLTEDGEKLLARARTVVEAAAAGLDELSDRGSEPSGVLKIALPAILAQSTVTNRVVKFSKKYPKVRLELNYSDSIVELIGSGCDLAIRMGRMADSSLKARKLSEFERYVVASPEYLESRDPPVSPEEIEDWDWVAMQQLPLKPKFRSDKKKTITLKPDPAHTVNDALALCQMTRAGAGLSILPSCLITQDIDNGVLKRILPSWSLEPIGIYVLWPQNSSKSGLAMKLVSELASHGE